MHSLTWQYPEHAWRWLISVIESKGEPVITEDGQLTREVRNLGVTITNPGQGWPINGSGWDIPALEEYVRKEILSPDIPPGFDYTYGDRLRDWPTWDQWYDAGESGFVRFDQINEQVIRPLISYPTTRRAIAITWHPGHDGRHGSHSPCLQSVNFLLRSGKLHLTAYFRSQDIAQAWPANMYGLNRLLEFVSDEVDAVPGSVTTFTASAHVYEV